MRADEASAAILSAIAVLAFNVWVVRQSLGKRLKYSWQGKLAGAELCPIELCDVGQLLLAFPREHHVDPSAVAAIPEALQKAALGHPVYQTHRGMVLNQQEICKFTHRHTVMRP